MPSTASATPIDTLHDIDLVRGHFSRPTGAQELTSAFQNFDQGPLNHLCVFFHGGLVSRSEGLDTASRLIGEYTNAGAYPFFFIWNSSLLDALKTRMQRYSDNPVFVTVANHAFQTVARKMKAALDKQKSLDIRLRLPARPPRSGPRTLEQLATIGRVYDQAWAKRAGAQLGCSQRELDQFAGFLLNAEKALPVKRRMFKPTRLAGRKNPLARILYRLNTCHDHGLYTTIVEELFIAAGLAALVRRKIWFPMVESIDRSFESESTAGGTAFVDHLCKSWTNNPTLRVTLIGHSMGSIYVQRMIEALNARLPEGSTAQLEVILLAAAISFARMNATLSVLRKRASGLRVFALNDKTESSYFEVPPIYDKSLLYIVSSLCENDPNADKSLVGMERYWSGMPPYCDPEIHAVTGFIDKKERSVWSPTKLGAKPGYRSHAKRHGEFPLEPCTRGSICYALANGF
jgi:hypothetical protein